MARIKIDYTNAYLLLKSVVDRYNKGRKITEVFIMSIMKDEVMLSDKLGMNTLVISNIDKDNITLQEARALAGDLMDIEDLLPYTIRSITSTWIKEFASLEVDDE